MAGEMSPKGRGGPGCPPTRSRAAGREGVAGQGLQGPRGGRSQRRTVRAPGHWCPWPPPRPPLQPREAILQGHRLQCLKASARCQVKGSPLRAPTPLARPLPGCGPRGPPSDSTAPASRRRSWVAGARGFCSFVCFSLTIDPAPCLRSLHVSALRFCSEIPGSSRDSRPSQRHRPGREGEAGPPGAAGARGEGPASTCFAR